MNCHLEAEKVRVVDHLQLQVGNLRETKEHSFQRDKSEYLDPETRDIWSQKIGLKVKKEKME
jgi:hypothetical protein